MEKCVCMHGARCDPETGSCVCKPGWRGRLCGKGEQFLLIKLKPVLVSWSVCEPRIQEDTVDLPPFGFLTLRVPALI